MAARKKSGRLYVRTDSDTHARLAKTAKALGVDLNGVVNLCLRTQMDLPSLELMTLADRTDDPVTKEAVLRLGRALTEFSAAMMAQSGLVMRGVRDPLGKSAIEHLISVMYHFAEEVKKAGSQEVAIPRPLRISEPSTEGEQSQPQEGSEKP